MSFEEVVINDKVELNRLYEVLIANIGQVVFIKFFEYYGDNITKENYQEKYAVIRGVTYDDKENHGRVSCALFGHTTPMRVNFDIGLITEIINENDEILFHRDITNLMGKQR